MAFTRNIGYMEGSGDPNADATIQAGGGNIPTLYVDTSVFPVQLYQFFAAVAVPNKWQKIGFDKFLPWVKTGNSYETLLSSVVSGDNVFRTGKTNMGANEATMPFENQYRQKFYGNSYNQGKFVNLEYSINQITAVSVVINPTTGSDILDDTAYPASAFQTATAAFGWINKCTAQLFNVTLSGTNFGNRATLTSIALTNKRIVVGAGHFDINGTFQLNEGTIEFTNTTIYCNVSQSIVINHGTLFLVQGSMNIGTAGVINCKNNSKIAARGAFTFSFTGDNQYILFDSISSVYDLELFTQSAGTPITFNVGIFTGCTIGKISPQITRFPYRLWISGGGSSFIIFNGTHAGGHFTVRGNDGISIQGFTDNDYLKGYVAHGAKSIYTPNEQTFADNEAAITGGCLVGEHYRDSNGVQKVVMTSGTANDQKSWATADRPVSPYPGMDGFNTTDLVREYWNGTNWIQY